MAEFVGTRADLETLETVCVVEDRFGVTIPDADLPGWRTVGDIHRSILGHSAMPRDGRREWARLQRLLSEGYGVPAELVTAGAEPFGDPLRLDDRGPPRWPAPDSEPGGKSGGKRGDPE
jgi:hypothetical protein